MLTITYIAPSSRGIQRQRSILASGSTPRSRALPALPRAVCAQGKTIGLGDRTGKAFLRDVKFTKISATFNDVN
jgi:hypothetical protein